MSLVLSQLPSISLGQWGASMFFFLFNYIDTSLSRNWHIGVTSWCWAMCSCHLRHLKSQNELASVCWLPFSSPVPCSSSSCSFCCQSLPCKASPCFSLFFLIQTCKVSCHIGLLHLLFFFQFRFLHSFHLTYVLPYLFSLINLSYQALYTVKAFQQNIQH